MYDLGLGEQRVAEAHSKRIINKVLHFYCEIAFDYAILYKSNQL